MLPDQWGITKGKDPLRKNGHRWIISGGCFQKTKPTCMVLLSLKEGITKESIAFEELLS
jgi:hypothetical protein